MPRAFGKIVGDNRQGYAILAVMASLFLLSVTAVTWLESLGLGTAPQLAGGAMEGKEVRYGVLGSTLFARSEEHTSELQSLMRISYAVFCLKKKKQLTITQSTERDNDQ